MTMMMAKFFILSWFYSTSGMQLELNRLSVLYNVIDRIIIISRAGYYMNNRKKKSTTLSRTFIIHPFLIYKNTFFVIHNLKHLEPDSSLVHPEVHMRRYLLHRTCNWCQGCLVGDQGLESALSWPQM